MRLVSLQAERSNKSDRRLRAVSPDICLAKERVRIPPDVRHRSTVYDQQRCGCKHDEAHQERILRNVLRPFVHPKLYDEITAGGESLTGRFKEVQHDTTLV